MTVGSQTEEIYHFPSGCGLESKDFIGALLGVVDLLPSLHLLLLEERDTVCEQLSVALDASIKVNNF
jgi:hypothetical protein